MKDDNYIEYTIHSKVWAFTEHRYLPLDPEGYFFKLKENIETSIKNFQLEQENRKLKIQIEELKNK